MSTLWHQINVHACASTYGLAKILRVIIHCCMYISNKQEDIEMGPVHNESGDVSNQQPFIPPEVC